MVKFQHGRRSPLEVDSREEKFAVEWFEKRTNNDLDFCDNCHGEHPVPAFRPGTF